MIEATYEDSKSTNKNYTLLNTIINTNADDDFESTYLIYFDLDNADILIESKKYIQDHNQQYLFITEQGNVPQFAPTTRDLKRVIEIPYKKKKNGSNKKDNKSIISGIQYIMNDVDLFPSTINKILNKIEKDFFKPEPEFPKNGKKGARSLQDKYLKMFEKIPAKGSLYALGYIYQGQKELVSEHEEYVELLKEYKFPSLKTESAKTGICDFCGQEKALIDDFGKGNYKLNSLKMFGSTYKKGFYNLNNKKDLWKTIRCCDDCIKILQKMDNRINDKYQIATLTSSSGKGQNQKRITIYLIIREFLGKNKGSNKYSDLNEIISTTFSSDSIHNTIKNLAELKNRFLTLPQNIALDLYFNIKSQQKNQVVYEVKNLSIPDIQNMLEKLLHLEKVKRLFYPNSYFNLNRIFQIISLYNYKVSVDTIKDFFFRKIPSIDTILKAMNKHLRSSVFRSYPANKSYLYNQLSMDLALLITFVNYLNKEYKMERITKSNILKEYEDDGDIKYHPKDIRQFVDKIYKNLEDWEISMMELGELIKNISIKLAQNNKKGREKVFLEQINFNGMDNEKLKDYLVFINKKIVQYSNDLKNRQQDFAEKLNQITIDIQNYEIDPKISVLRIIDGFNLKTRAWRMANEINNNKNEQ
jgi:hypothetical protein